MKQMIYSTTSSRNSRSRIFASEEAERFEELYDSGDPNHYQSYFSLMEDIMDKYGTAHDLPTEIYDRASAEDKRRLMKLARKVNGINSSSVSEDRIRRAEQILVDNGIEEDEAPIVLQAIGYALLDEELYE